MTTRDILAQTFTIISGDEINMTVKKGSTRVDAPPKRKHIYTLSQYINNPRANFIHLIDCLSLRFRKKNWMVSLKALLITHYLMNQKNLTFMSHLSKRTSLFEISGYIDNSNTFSVDMSPRVTLYAKFLSIKSEIYRIFSLDITLKTGQNENFDINQINEIFQQVEYLEKMGNAIIDNDVDFNVPSPIINSVHTVLLKEYLRLYSAQNSRMIFLLQNLNDMEASEAVRVIPHYHSLCETHKNIESLLNAARLKGIEGITDIKLSAPSRELMTSIEEFIKDIIKIRGTPRLQREWHITPVEAAQSLMLRSGELIDVSNMNKNNIPSTFVSDLYDVFSSQQSLNTTYRGKISLDYSTLPSNMSSNYSSNINSNTASNFNSSQPTPIITDPYEREVRQKQIGYPGRPIIPMTSRTHRAITIDENQFSSAPNSNSNTINNIPTISKSSEDGSQRLPDPINDLDKLIFANMNLDPIHGVPPISQHSSNTQRSPAYMERPGWSFDSQNQAQMRNNVDMQGTKNLKNPFL